MHTGTKNIHKLFNLLLAGSLLLALGSCQKDPAVAEPAPNPGTARLKEYKNGDEFIRFFYNADGSLKKATVKSELNTGGAEVDYTVSYNAQKKISQITTIDGERIVPVYENGLMKRADYFLGTARGAYTNYLYEGDLLKRVTIYLNQGGNDYQPLLEFDFTYNAGGNPVETVTMMASGQPNHMERAGHITCVYDQKSNPLYEMRDFLALLWQAAPKNNVVREDHFDADLSPEDVYTYAYMYNANGFPESGVVRIDVPGQPTTTTTLSFIYQ